MCSLEVYEMKLIVRSEPTTRHHWTPFTRARGSIPFGLKRRGSAGAFRCGSSD
jgi:hypothetical protein